MPTHAMVAKAARHLGTAAADWQTWRTLGQAGHAATRAQTTGGREAGGAALQRAASPTPSFRHPRTFHSSSCQLATP